MKDLRLTITIGAPINDLFWFTLNPKNTSKWVDGITAEKTSEWPTKLGTEYQNTSDGSRWTTYVITNFDEPTSFTMSDLKTGYNVRYAFKQLDEEVTFLEYYEWMSDGELDEPFSLAHLEKLKQVVELELG